MNRLYEKIVLITGASSGIGRATAFEYARNGAKLILCARREDRLNVIASEIKTECANATILVIKMDVSDRNGVFESIENLPVEFKNIDILVNNAGLAVGVDQIADVPMEKIDIMLNTNVKGLLNVTQAVIGQMKRRNCGAIVMVNSIAGIEAYPGGSGYCASKHAVTAITKSLRHELISTNINVISIEPGILILTRTG
jgi:3-hydroxy acid dehydrogenase / malonic semialdehyde reductase